MVPCVVTILGLTSSNNSKKEVHLCASRNSTFLPGEIEWFIIKCIQKRLVSLQWEKQFENLIHSLKFGSTNLRKKEFVFHSVHIIMHRHHSFWILLSTVLGDISICHTWNLSLCNYLLLFLARKLMGIGVGGCIKWEIRLAYMDMFCSCKAWSCSCVYKQWWESAGLGSMLQPAW